MWNRQGTCGVAFVLLADSISESCENEHMSPFRQFPGPIMWNLHGREVGGALTTFERARDDRERLLEREALAELEQSEMESSVISSTKQSSER